MNNLDKFIQEQEAKRQIETKKLLDKINYRQGLINEKDKIIKNLNYEKELITNDIIELVRNLTSSELALLWGNDNRVYHYAWLYQNQEIANEKNIDKCKNANQLVLMQIENKILLKNKDFKLQGISVYGYDGRGYSFIYKYKKHTFELYVPMFNLANKETYKDMLLGYQVLIQTGEHSWSMIFCDLSPDVVAKKLKEYIEKLEEKE